MSFFEYWIGCIGTAVLMLLLMPMAFSRESPVFTILMATIAVVMVIMPLAYLTIYYLVGGVL